MTGSLPKTLPGHWDTPEGLEMAMTYADRDRSQLPKGEMSDLAIANGVFMADRGDLDLIVWQTAAQKRIRWLSVQLALFRHREDAVARGLAEQVEEAMQDGAGFWRSCSGCYETCEGYATGAYPFSEALKCVLGAGCRECGGIGAIWDNTDYEDMAEFMLKLDRDHINIAKILIDGGVPSHQAGELAQQILDLEAPA